MTRFLINRWRWAVLVVLLLGAAAAFVQARNSKNISVPSLARKKGQPIPVRTAQVKEEEIEDLIGGTVLTRPAETADIQLGPSRDVSNNAPLSVVTVKAIHAHHGSFVREGDPILDVNVTQLDEFVKQQEVALEAAQAELARVKEQVSYNRALRDAKVASTTAQVDSARTTEEARDKQHEIYIGLSRKNAASLFDLYNAFIALVQAKFQHAEARRDYQLARVAITVGALADKAAVTAAVNGVKTAEVNLALARKDLERSHVTSPISGFVSYPNLKEPGRGQVLTVSTPVLSVMRLDPLMVVMDLPQDRLDDVSVGQEANVVLDSFPKETFQGKVIRISPEVNPATRVLPILIAVPNPKNRLKSGISGFARLRHRKTAAVVPAMAVIRQGDREMVFCVEEGRARIREVQTGGLTAIGEREVLSGLKVGTEVVIFHNFYREAGNLVSGGGFLQDNDRVDTDWRRWTRRVEEEKQ
jgi:RND family efflux transporter MFP subunit